MGLVVKRAGAAEYGQKVKLLLCGNPGSGKTRTSSTWPNVFFANAEGGMMSVTDRQVPFVDIAGTEDLNRLRLALSQAPHIRERELGVAVDTIVLDTIDEIQRLLIRERLSEQKKEAMAQADWGWLGDQLRGIVRGFRNLDLHVIFTCHVRDVTDSETERTYVKPSLQGAMQDEIAAYVDLAVLLKAQPTAKVIDGESRRVMARFMQTMPDVNHPWLKDRSGKLPMDFEIDLNTDFARMNKAIFGQPQVPSETVTEVGPQRAPAGPKSPPRADRKAEKAAPAPAATLPTAEEPANSPTETEVPRTGTPPEEPTKTEPEPQPEPQSEPEPQPDAEPQPVDDPPATQAPGEASSLPPCNACGGVIETEDQLDLSRIRYRKPLCKPCFIAAKKK